MNNLGYIEVETKHAAKGKIITFEATFFYSDKPAFRRSDSIYRQIDFQLVQEQIETPNQAQAYQARIVAKWRSLWIGISFAELCLLALIRLFYLGTTN